VLVRAILVDLDFETFPDGTVSIVRHPHVAPGGEPFSESFCAPDRVNDLVVRIDSPVCGNPLDYQVAIVILFPLEDRDGNVHEILCSLRGSS